MHGLVNRTIEQFLRQSQGEACWREIAASAGVDLRGFQAMRNYPDEVTSRLVQVAHDRLGKTEHELLEDVGHWLAQIEPLRRLLRFSGTTFDEFLLSLDELPDRVRMVLPDVILPRIAVTRGEDSDMLVRLTGEAPQWQYVFCGLIRAMADDYGALALLLEDEGQIVVRIPDAQFAEGRSFSLYAGSGG